MGRGENEGVHASHIKAAEMQVARLLSRRLSSLRRRSSLPKKALGFSLEKFAANFDLTGSGVRKWEEEKKKIPLDLITQITLRVFFSHKFNLPLTGNFNSLRGLEKKQRILN